jgi:hypothetical protein
VAVIVAVEPLVAGAGRLVLDCVLDCVRVAVVEAAREPAVGAGDALSPPLPDETTTATITPATAATATAAASRAFLTGREATLAPRCEDGSRSS